MKRENIILQDAKELAVYFVDLVLIGRRNQIGFRS